MFALLGVVSGVADGVFPHHLQPSDGDIGTDVLGSVLPHTLDIKNGLLFA